MTMRRVFTNWNEIEYLIWRGTQKLQKLPITSVYGIPRGGLIPAVMLSHKLGVPVVTLPREGSLIVDDIADSGETLQEIEKMYGEGVWTFTLWKRVGGGYTPTVWMKELPVGEWLVYPWENNEEGTAKDNTFLPG